MKGPSKVLLKNTVYPKQAFLFGSNNSVKNTKQNDEAKVDYDYMKKNLQLKKKLAELQKENDFLK